MDARLILTHQAHDLLDRLRLAYYHRAALFARYPSHIPARWTDRRLTRLESLIARAEQRVRRRYAKRI